MAVSEYEAMDYPPRLYDQMAVSEYEAMDYPPRLYNEGASNLEDKTISTNSRMSSVLPLKEQLGTEVWDKLLEFPVGVIANLADIKLQWSGKIVHYLLCRQLRVHKKEIWCLVVDQPLRFSIHEFGEITGLNTDPLPTEPFEPDQYKIFWKKLKVDLWRGPRLDELQSALRVCQTWTFEERKWLGLLCLQAMGLYAKHHNSEIPFESAKRVFDDEAMMTYPWGRTAFEVLVDSVKLLNPQKKSYTISGLKEAFLVWAFESVACFGERFGKQADKHVIPLLRWRGTRTHSDLATVISQDIKAHGELRVRKMVIKEAVEELFSQWPDEEHDPQLVKLITDIHADRFVRGFWDVKRNENNKIRKAVFSLESDQSPAKKQKKVKKHKEVSNRKASADVEEKKETAKGKGAVGEALKARMTSIEERLASIENDRMQMRESLTCLRVAESAQNCGKSPDTVKTPSKGAVGEALKARMTSIEERLASIENDRMQMRESLTCLRVAESAQNCGKSPDTVKTPSKALEADNTLNEEPAKTNAKGLGEEHSLAEDDDPMLASAEDIVEGAVDEAPDARMTSIEDRLASIENDPMQMSERRSGLRVGESAQNYDNFQEACCIGFSQTSVNNPGPTMDKCKSPDTAKGTNNTLDEDAAKTNAKGLGAKQSLNDEVSKAAELKKNLAEEFDNVDPTVGGRAVNIVTVSLAKEKLYGRGCRIRPDIKKKKAEEMSRFRDGELNMAKAELQKMVAVLRKEAAQLITKAASGKEAGKFKKKDAPLQMTKKNFKGNYDPKDTAVTNPASNLKNRIPRKNKKHNQNESEPEDVTEELMAQIDKLLPESDEDEEENTRSARIKVYRESNVQLSSNRFAVRSQVAPPARVFPYIGEDEMTCMRKNYEASPAIYDPLAPADPAKVDKLMNLLKPFEKTPLEESQDDNIEFYRRLITVRALWKYEKYGWLYDNHVGAYIRVLIGRSMRDPSPFYSKRIAFLDTRFIHSWNLDYNAFIEKSKPFQFKDSGFELLVSGKMPEDQPTNLKWIEDVDHLYGVQQTGGEHWVAFHVDLLKEKIDCYDPIIGQVTPESEERILNTFRMHMEFIPAMINDLVPAYHRKRSYKKFGFRRRRGNIPQNTLVGDCAVYSLKFVECLALGITFDGICDKNIQGIRVKMATEILEAGIDMFKQFK